MLLEVFPFAGTTPALSILFFVPLACISLGIPLARSSPPCAKLPPKEDGMAPMMQALIMQGIGKVGFMEKPIR
jgi:hypothetical protein